MPVPENKRSSITLERYSKSNTHSRKEIWGIRAVHTGNDVMLC